jgi:hypothetical protein
LRERLFLLSRGRLCLLWLISFRMWPRQLHTPTLGEGWVCTVYMLSRAVCFHTGLPLRARVRVRVRDAPWP